MKKIISAILAIVLIISLVAPASASDYYYPKYNGSGGLVDGLNAVGAPSTFAARQQLAEANGVPAGEYQGTAQQNTYLLSLLCAGRLKMPGAPTGSAGSGHFYPRYGGSSNSIIEALNSLGIDSSYAHRALIAKVNGYGSSYSGKANENIDLLNKLKAGVLVNPHAATSQNAQSSGVAVQTVGSASTRDVTYIEVTSSTAPLRSGPGKNYNELATLQSGDCLIYIEFTINQHQNTWIKVKYGDGVAYLHEPHAVIHQHSYRAVADGFNTCKCGSYTIDEGSTMMQTSVGVATAGTLLTAEAVLAAGELSAMGTAISTGLAAAFPYVAVVAVGSMLIYMGVSASGTQVRDVRFIRSKEDVQKLLDNEYDSAAPYYKACTLDGKSTLLMSLDGMDLNTAAKYLKSTVTNPIYATTTAITKKPLVSIWCFENTDALRLAEKYAKYGNQYGYGSSSAYDCNYESDSEKYPGKIYFEHYHLWYRPGFANYMKKVDDAHIFFGFPDFSTHA